MSSTALAALHSLKWERGLVASPHDKDHQSALFYSISAAVKSLLPAGRALWTIPLSVADPRDSTATAASIQRMVSEHSLLLDAVANFLADAVRKFRLLYSFHADTIYEEESGTLHLWTHVVIVCTAVSGWCRTWSLEHLQGNIRLEAGLNMLLGWVLEMQGSPACLGFSLAVSGSQETWRQQVLMMMRIPLYSLAYGAGARVRSMQQIGTLLSLACKLMSVEAALPGPKLAPMSDITCVGFTCTFLVAVMRWMECNPNSPLCQQLQRGLLGDTFMEAVKRVLVADATHHNPKARNTVSTVRTLLRTLTLFKSRYTGQQASPAIAPSSTDSNPLTANTSSNSSGTSGTSNVPQTSPHTTTSDESLLFALRVTSVLHPDSRYDVNRIICDADIPWGLATADEDPPGEPTLRCLRGMTHHVVLHILLWMKNKQHIKALQLAIRRIGQEFKAVCYEEDLLRQHSLFVEQNIARMRPPERPARKQQMDLSRAQLAQQLLESEQEYKEELEEWEHTRNLRRGTVQRNRNEEAELRAQRVVMQKQLSEMPAEVQKAKAQSPGSHGIMLLPWMLCYTWGFTSDLECGHGESSRKRNGWKPVLGGGVVL